MSLTTFSAFIYGHDITDDNQWIDFTEDGMTELSAQIDINSYTLTDFANAVVSAMNEVGGQEYSIALDRTTRKITISAASSFTLLTDGTHSEISAFSLMGFTANQTGTDLEGDTASGSYYEPQFKLQQYVDFQDIVEASDSSVNESASGLVEVVSFGQNNYMECNITYITNIIGQGVIKNNANGVSDLRKFMLYAIQKKPLEFIPDIDGVSFNSCLLESTQANRNGTGFQLYELYGRGLANYYETKKIRFREL